ncbi:restriction endonuclease subunit S, partial [Methanosphaera cuniculi]|uniref:restriction endonuclease subunit S n=1 Tax=Methanosphaera cuniculi TaxID=1077256 RepID=UPI0026DCFCB2
SKKRLDILQKSELQFYDESLKEVTLGDICEFSKGKGILKNDLSDEGIPCIIYGELYTHYDEIISNIKSKTDLNKDNLVLSSKYDIIMPDCGETAIDLANTSCILREDVAIGMDTIILKTKQNPIFLTYYIRYKRNEIAKIGQGSSIVHIYPKDLKKIKIKIPTLKKQNKISNFLVKVNEKINLMEQKNKKIKYDVKNYLLSNLFVENKEEDILSWNEEDLDNISSISTGNCDLKDNIEDGKYPFFVRSEKVERIDSYAYDGEAILIPGDGRVGEIFHYINGKFNYHQRVYKISDFKDVIGKYVYYYLQQYFLRHVHKYSVKGTVDSLRLPIIKEMKIRYPSIKKQEKIVNILSCVDKKIELSNKQIDLMKNYKKGLLQKMFI